MNRYNAQNATLTMKAAAKALVAHGFAKVERHAVERLYMAHTAGSATIPYTNGRVSFTLLWDEWARGFVFVGNPGVHPHDLADIRRALPAVIVVE